VPGLLPENVTIIDSDSGRVLSGDEAENPAGDAGGLAETLRRNVQRLLNARVGPGNAVVEVNVEIETARQTVFERIIDPASRVVIGTESEESSNTSREAGDGAVTVASNLPDGEGGGGEGSSSQASETRERINYEVSETMREVTRSPGAVRRLTVAVLVNGTFETQEDGSPGFVPLPDAEQEALRALVASAVGFDAERGDEITIRSLPFERPEGLGSGPIEPGFLTGSIDMMRLAQMGVLGLVALLLGLFVVRPILARPAAAAASAAALPAPAMGPALDGEIEMASALPDLPMLSDGPDFGAMGMVDFDSPASEDPVERLRSLIEERKTESVEILRSWLDEKERT
jgi:flagellar M-ring protein FliF